jgi:ACS family pantothenate transporter-like MFS transporter
VGLVLIFCYIVFTVWNVPHGLKMAAYILSGAYGCFSPMLAGWANSVCGGDQQLRAFILGWMVSFGNALVTPFQQYQFASSEAPHYAKAHGWPSALAFVVALTLWSSFGIDGVRKVFERRAKRGSISVSGA